MLMRWLSENYIEVLGAITGLIYLYFSIRRLIWLWPLGIVTSAFYVIIFFEAKFYADMSLQVYYFVISFYGWYNWLYGKEKTGKVKVKNAGPKLLIWFSFLSILITVILSYILIEYTDSPLPVWDAFTTAGSIMATWMLAHKMLENWLFWIVIDLISMGLYLYKGLYPTAFLFLVYSSMAVLGYFKWKNDMVSDVE